MQTAPASDGDGLILEADPEPPAALVAMLKTVKPAFRRGPSTYDFCIHAQGRLGYISLIGREADQWRRARQSYRWFSATSERVRHTCSGNVKSSPRCGSGVRQLTLP